MVATAPPTAQGTRRPTNFPWNIHSNLLGEDLGAYAVGGTCLVLTANGNLNVGDAVYGQAAFTVDKSTTAGNQVLRVGVVVGGIDVITGGTLEAIERLSDVGVQVGEAGDAILVCVSGVCYVTLDSAGAVAAWVPVKLSTTTSGRVAVATAGTDAGKILGYAVDAATSAGDKLRILVNPA